MLDSFLRLVKTISVTARSQYVYKPTIVALSGSTARLVACGGSNTCIITASGGVRCWGSNNHGQLGTDVIGIGGAAFYPPTVDITLRGPASTIAVGTCFVCAVISGSYLFCWGANAAGQLGDNTVVDTYITATTPSMLMGGVIELSLGPDFTCALVQGVAGSLGGSVKCWGNGGMCVCVRNAYLQFFLLFDTILGSASVVVFRCYPCPAVCDMISFDLSTGNVY